MTDYESNICSLSAVWLILSLPKTQHIKIFRSICLQTQSWKKSNSFMVQIKESVFLLLHMILVLYPLLHPPKIQWTFCKFKSMWMPLFRSFTAHNKQSSIFKMKPKLKVVTGANPKDSYVSYPALNQKINMFKMNCFGLYPFIITVHKNNSALKIYLWLL